MIIKILESGIRKTEPCWVIYHKNKTILFNTPKTLPKIKGVDYLFYTHVHSENTCGIDNVVIEDKLIPTYIYKDFELHLHRDISNIHEKLDLVIMNPYKTIDIDGLKITPLLVTHLVQQAYKEEIAGFSINDSIVIATPMRKIVGKSIHYLQNASVVLIDGGYYKEEKYQDHHAALKTLKGLQHSDNIKYIGFLGTDKVNITGRLRKKQNCKVDTLKKGDILRIS